MDDLGVFLKRWPPSAQSAGAARCVGSKNDDLNENPADVHWFDKDDTDDKVVCFFKYIFWIIHNKQQVDCP